MAGPLKKDRYFFAASLSNILQIKSKSRKNVHEPIMVGGSSLKSILLDTLHRLLHDYGCTSTQE